TKEILAARTAVAWMGMVSATWRHAIDGHALTIVEELNTLHDSLPKEALTPRTEQRLAKLHRIAKAILEKPITPPLSSEEGVTSVPINALLRERLQQLWQNEPYKSSNFRFISEIDSSLTVRASSEWIRRILDIIIDNAIESMLNSNVREI